MLRLRQLWMTLAVLFAIASIGNAAQDFHSLGDATADLVLSFTTTHISATIGGSVTLSGVVELGGQPVEYEARGPVSGRGRVSLGTGEAEAWLIIEADGVTHEGAPISIGGGIVLTEVTATESGGELGSGAGRFVFRIASADFDIRVQGEAIGSATGHFVIPKETLSMQIAGAATFEMVGEEVTPCSTGEDQSTAPPASEDDILEIATWPEDLAEALSTAFDGVTAASPG